MRKHIAKIWYRNPKVIITPRKYPPRTYNLAINPLPNEDPGSIEWAQEFAAILGDNHVYWRGRVAVSGEIADRAGHRVAKDITGAFDSSISTMKRLLLQGALGGLEAEDREEVLEAFGVGAAGEDLRMARRKALGALAVSRLITCVLVPERLFPGRRDASVTLGDAESAQVSPDFILDMDADETGMPHDYRLHVPLTVANDPLIFPTGPYLDAWYFGRRDGSDVEVPQQEDLTPGNPRHARDPSQGNLWIHRTAADLSDGLVLHLQEHGITPPTDVATLFPFIPDRDRIPVLGGIQ